MEIRHARSEDAARLSNIARAAKASWGYSSAWLSFWESDLHITAEYIQDRDVCVAVVAGKVVGFISLARASDRWTLEHLWVKPELQGRQVGKRLYEHALELIQTAGGGLLAIEADPNAAGFYLRMGAQQQGSIPAPMVGDPERKLPILVAVVRPPNKALLPARAKSRKTNSARGRARR